MGAASAIAARRARDSTIAPRWVLTAAHCTFAEDGVNYPPGSLTAVVGRHDRNDLATGRQSSLLRVFVHPDWGMTEAGGNSEALRQTELPATTAPACEAWFAQAPEYPTFDAAGTLCAGFACNTRTTLLALSRAGAAAAGRSAAAARPARRPRTPSARAR